MAEQLSELDQPWLFGAYPPIIAGTMRHLQCDRYCRIEVFHSVMGDSTVRHERKGEVNMVTVPPAIGVDPLENYVKALEPLVALHWHEPIPNWVGEAV